MKRIKRLLLRQIILGWFLIAGTIPVSAQYQIKSWTTDDGLPQNTVYSIVQTRDGYLWLATLDGLVRFDGVKFTVFNKNNTPGILSNRFTRIIEDGSGDLWIVTEESGIMRYHDGVFRTFPVVKNATSKPLWRVAVNRGGQARRFDRRRFGRMERRGIHFNRADCRRDGDEPDFLESGRRVFLDYRTDFDASRTRANQPFHIARQRTGNRSEIRFMKIRAARSGSARRTPD